MLLKFQKEFEKSNAINSYLKMCEIFIFLCEEKQYIDSCLYESFLNFKNMFIENYKQKSFLGFQSACVKNKEKIAKELLNIIKCTGIKIEELG